MVWKFKDTIRDDMYSYEESYTYMELKSSVWSCMSEIGVKQPYFNLQLCLFPVAIVFTE